MLKYSVVDSVVILYYPLILLTLVCKAPILGHPKNLDMVEVVGSSPIVITTFNSHN